MSDPIHSFHIDIESNSSTIEKLKKQFGVEDHEDLFIIIMKQTEYYKYHESCNSQLTALEDLQVGDVISVAYTPCSQKYLDYYDEQNVKGKVFFIDVENDDALVYRDESCHDAASDTICIHTYIKSIRRLGCGYYGDKAYYESIYVNA